MKYKPTPEGGRLLPQQPMKARVGKIMEAIMLDPKEDRDPRLKSSLDRVGVEVIPKEPLPPGKRPQPRAIVKKETIITPVEDVAPPPFKEGGKVPGTKGKRNLSRAMMRGKRG